MENMERLDRKFWKNKKVLVTGHTGFKGAWASFVLNELGCKVYACALKPKKNQILFDQLNLKNILKKNEFFNICNEKKLNDFILKSQPEIIFHFAAQPYVIDSYKEPIETLKTNVLGTMNILNLKKFNFIKFITVITSDKCYENTSKKNFFSEYDRLGGNDIYSSSKACCELLVNAYRKSFCNNKNIISVRAGNVIGGGDFGSYRLMTDFFKCVKYKKKLQLRNPNYVRPWQHIFDVLNGYFLVTQKCYKNPLKYSSAWNFGPEKNGHVKVSDLVSLFNDKLEKKIKISLKKETKYSEEKYLFLNISKSKKELNWKPKFKIDDVVKHTLDWYLNYFTQKKSYDFSLSQVNTFKF